MYVVVAASALSLASATLLYWRSGQGQKGPLPPGPPGLPIVGNLFDTTCKDKHVWEVYKAMSEKYGDVIYLEFFGKPVVVVNSLEAADELFERRGANYADRPELHMANDLVGWSWDLAHMRYSPWWRLHRKTLHQYFQPRRTPDYQPIQLKATSVLLESLLQNPDMFAEHLRSYTGSIILRLTYGYEVTSTSDEYVVLVKNAVEGLSQTVNHGSFLVDFLPFLKKIPAWFPGASFKRKAAMWRKPTLMLKDKPFALLKEALAEGQILRPSFVSKNLLRMEHADKLSVSSEEMEDVIRNCAGISYLAGSHTTASVLLSMIQAMVLHPHCQTRAQEELDRVVSNQQLPIFEDRESLPYIEAILSEVLRWRPVVPLAIAHAAVSEDIYNGYRIPAGCTVIGNAWAMLSDPKNYPDPFTFKPERFLKEGHVPPDPAVAFGFGRRICPGRHLAMDSAWIAIVSILHVYRLSPACDEKGNHVLPKADYTPVSGAVTHPVPFKCYITPRSGAALGLVRKGHD